MANMHRLGFILLVILVLLQVAMAKPSAECARAMEKWVKQCVPTKQYHVNTAALFKQAPKDSSAYIINKLIEKTNDDSDFPPVH